MSNELLYSMRDLAQIVMPCLEIASARHVVEIGAGDGDMSRLLADRAEATGGLVTTIDPAPAAGFDEWCAGTRVMRHLRAPSLDVIATQDDADAWLLDGDHNWFTVYHELGRIRERMRVSGRPMLAFVHEVSWPCARRDAYYAPERIPAEFRHPHSYDSGVVLDTLVAIPNSGLQGGGRFAWATVEGGERNGVLSAVEDFVSDATDAGDRLGWAFVPAMFGLGVLYDLDASWASPLASFLAPYHNSQLLAGELEWHRSSIPISRR